MIETLLWIGFILTGMVVGAVMLGAGFYNGRNAYNPPEEEEDFYDDDD